MNLFACAVAGTVIILGASAISLSCVMILARLKKWRNTSGSFGREDFDGFGGAM